MNNIMFRIVNLIIGFFVTSFGIVCMIHANLGMPPWDVLHQGLSQMFKISFGNTVILLSVVLVIINRLLGEKIKLGTFLNMLFIGYFIDLINKWGLVPEIHSFVKGLVLLFVGMIIMAVGTYLYLRVQLGPGPKDGLMIAFNKRTNKPVRLVRGTMEISVVILGYFLGGYVGIGTLISAFSFGYILQCVFYIFKFKIQAPQTNYVSSSEV